MKFSLSLKYERISLYKKHTDRIKPELTKKFFVNSIGLFGSVVRDDFNDSSDIDILVDFTRPIGIEFI